MQYIHSIRYATKKFGYVRRTARETRYDRDRRRMYSKAERQRSTHTHTQKKNRKIGGEEMSEKQTVGDDFERTDMYSWPDGIVRQSVENESGMTETERSRAIECK